MTTYRRLLAVTILWAIQGCVDGYEIPKDADLVQTTAVVRAPLNRGGDVVIEHEGREVQRAPIDDNGYAQINLPGLKGDFTAKATGGYYKDPVTGTKVAMHGQSLHGYARGVKLLEKARIAVTPWSELLYAYWKAHPEDNAVTEAEKALDSALGCGMVGTALAFPAAPAADTPISGTGHGEMGYVHLGAWKHLAGLIGDEVGLSQDGVVPMQVVRALSDAIGKHGRVTGQIEIAPKRFVDAGLLRQRYAQAMRRFVEGKPDHVLLRTAPIKAFLECVSEAKADMWGPDGENLDLTAPEITEMHVPEIFAAPFLVSCKAKDDSTVKTMRIEVRQQNKLVPTQATPGEKLFEGKNTPEARFGLTLDPAFLEEGDVSITCTAWDKWDNEASKTVASTVNRNLGTVLINVSPREDKADGAHVKAAVTITCECRDRYLRKDDACGLSPASLALPGISRSAFEQGKATYMWDTLQGIDGWKHLVCQGRSEGIESPKLSDPRDVWVQNHKPAEVIVHVHLDTPVRGARVRAYVFESGRKGRELGCSSGVSSESGEAEIKIGTDYAGPILFEATAEREMNRAKPSYQALALGEDVRMDDHVLSMLWDDYSPARGDLPRELHINAATTLAKALAVGIYNHQSGAETDKWAAAIYRAHELMGKHLNPDDPGLYGLDPRRTAVADLSKLSDRNTAKSDNSVRLGLFHVGLSRLASESGEATPRSYNALELIDVLCQDALSGVFNGRESRKGHVVGLGHYELTAETLRRDLAAATRRWIRNDSLHGQVYAMSQLAPRDFSRRGQYLVTLAEDASAMFGAVDGIKPFDEDGPALKLKVRQGGNDDETAWSEMPAPGQVFRGFVHLEAWAEDDSDVVELDIDFGGTNLVKGITGIRGDKFDIGGTKAHAKFTVNTALLDDGEARIDLKAKDRIGNPNSLTMVIAIDNKKPTVTMPPRFTSHDGQVIIMGEVDKDVREVRVEQGRALIAVLTSDEATPKTRSFSIPATLTCDATHTLTITATDYAGNDSDPVDVVVWCDSQPPALHWMPTTYEMEFTGGRAPMRSDMTIQKHLHRLGRRDLNRAAVRFYADDRTQEPARFGSHPKNVKAKYQFEFHSNGHVHATEWKTLDAIEDVSFPENVGYEVDFTYESMLPAEVLQLNAVAIRAGNYISRCSPADMHVLVVRLEDEAGNVTEGRFSAHLDVRSAPVELTCGLENVSNASTLTIENMQHLAKQGQRPFSITAEWKIPDDQVSTASELAPLMSEVTARVKLPTAARQVLVDQSIKQITVLKRTLRRNNTDGEGCRDDGKRWARVWSDQECEPHDGDTRNSMTPVTGNTAFLQSMMPEKPSVYLRGAPGNPEKVAYTTVDSAPFEIARDITGREHLQTRFRTAIEYERNLGWAVSPDWVYLDERLFADSLLMFHNIRGASVSVDAFPSPSKVRLSQSCTQMWSYKG